MKQLQILLFKAVVFALLAAPSLMALADVTKV